MTQSTIRIQLTCWGFLTGCFCYFSSLNMLVSSFACFIIINYIYRKSPQKLITLSIIILSFLISQIYCQLRDTKPQNHLIHLPDSRTELTGRICREPKSKQEETIYVVCINKPYKGKLQVQTSSSPKYHYNDSIKVFGLVKSPENFGDFDYKKFLAAQGIYKTSYHPQISILTQTSSPLRTLYIFKNQLINQVGSFLIEPNASLFAGLLIGYNGGLTPSLDEQFKLTGMSHIIAVSGANIALVVLVLDKTVFRFTNTRTRYPAMAFFIAIYCLICGLSASVVRAGIMGMLTLYATTFGKQAQSLHLLLISAIMICIVNPRSIANDAGFQLSYLAVLGIIFLAPKFQALWQQKNYLSEAISISLAAQLATIPIIASQFKLLSLTALPLNLIIGPLLPVTINFGLLNLLISYFSPKISILCSAITNLLLKIIIKLIEFAASLEKLNIQLEKTASITLSLLAAIILMRSINTDATSKFDHQSVDE